MHQRPDEVFCGHQSLLVFVKLNKMMVYVRQLTAGLHAWKRSQEHQMYILNSLHSNELKSGYSQATEKLWFHGVHKNRAIKFLGEVRQYQLDWSCEFMLFAVLPCYQMIDISGSLWLVLRCTPHRSNPEPTHQRATDIRTVWVTATLVSSVNLHFGALFTRKGHNYRNSDRTNRKHRWLKWVTKGIELREVTG